MLLAEPTTKTISQENAKTTTVRIAVAMSESVFLIPHFARMAVNPAKTDDKIAATNHIFIPSNDTLYVRREVCGDSHDLIGGEGISLRTSVPYVYFSICHP